MSFLAIFISQSLWIISLCGLGSILSAVLKKRDVLIFGSPHQLIFLSGIAGYLMLTLTGTIINFFSPLDEYVSMSALTAGLLLFAINRRLLLDGLSGRDFFATASVLSVIWLMSLPGVTDMDTATYHLQIIKWAKHSTAPLGLANMHGRLGYNSTWFVAGAMVELPFGAKSPFVLNPVLLFFYIGLVVAHYRKKVEAGFSSADCFLLMTIVPAAWSFMTNSVAATSTDLPVMLLSFLAFYLTAVQIESGRKDIISGLVVFALAGFIFTIKVSSVFILIAAASYLLHILIAKSGGHKRSSPLKTASIVLILTLLILGPWAARGIATSGCLSFPLTAGCFYGLPWSVPQAFVEYEEDFVMAYARDNNITPSSTYSVLGNWGWLQGWTERWFFGSDIIKIAPLLALGAAGLYLAWRRRIAPWRIGGPLFFVIASSLAGAIFWFFSAPDFRFGAGYLYSLAIALLSGGLQGFRRLESVYARKRVFTAVLVILAAASALNFGRLALVGSRFASIPEPDLSRQVRIDGVTVYYPPTGDCWDAPLPCTTFLDKGLRISQGKDNLPDMFWFESVRR